MNHIIVQQEVTPLLREEADRLNTARRYSFLWGAVFIILVQPIWSGIWSSVSDWWAKLPRSQPTPAGRPPESSAPPGPPVILPPASVAPTGQDAPSDLPAGIRPPPGSKVSPGSDDPHRRRAED